MTPLRFYFLGVPHLERDGRTVEMTVAKAIALLAFLALTQEAQHRDRVVDFFWPESSPNAARKNLRNTLWIIRSALGDEVIRAEGERLSLAEVPWVDAHELERLAGETPATAEEQEAAIKLYRGPLLDGLRIADAPEWELWLAAESERLEQAYLRLVSRLIERKREAGQWADVVVLARTALGHDSLQEPMHRALIEAHARLGERPEALRQYDLLREVLSQELGVEPLPETESLRDALLSGAIGPESHTSLPAPAPRVAGPPASDVPYVGRQEELAVLDQAYDRAATGQAQVVLLAGEIGIGKSRLWREWVARRKVTGHVLETAALAATQGLPFAPLIQLFTSPAISQRLFSARSPLSRPWLAEIARLLPEVHALCPDLPELAPLPAEEERRRLFEAFTRAVQLIDGSPLLLFLDDVHWADPTTLDWLAYLVHRMQGQSLLLVLAYRPAEAPAPLVQLLATWSRLGIVTRLTLHPLSNEESSTLLEALIPDPARRSDLARHIQTQSAGNPYFLIELARVSPGDIPPALADLIRARIGRLSGGAQQVLQAAAVVAPGFTFNVLRQCSGRGEEETLDALDELLNGGILVEREGEYAFSHPLVMSVVEEGLSGARRAFLHRRAAAAREIAHAGHVERVAGTIAIHYREAGDTRRAAEYFEMAARRAYSLVAFSEAVEFYWQALALEPTPERLLGLGKALSGQGELDEARAVLGEALDAFEAEGNKRGAVRASLQMASSYLPSGHGHEVQRWASRALSYLDAAGDPEGHAEAHFLMGAGLLQGAGPLSEAEAHLTEATKLAARHGFRGVEASSRFELGNLLAQRGQLERAIASFRDSVRIAEEVGDPIQAALGHNNAAYHSLLLGNLDDARRHVEMGLAMVEEGDFQLPRQYLYSTRGELALAEESWEEAERWFRRGLSEAERRGNRRQVANYHANLALVARGRQEWDNALLLLQQAREEAIALPAPHLRIRIELWMAELYHLRGERSAARGALKRAEALLASGERAELLARARQLKEALEKD